MRNKPDSLDIFGSLDDGDHYEDAQILELLAAEQVELHQGEQFTGRPATRVHTLGGHVLKIREDVTLRAETGPRWIARRLDREKELAVHHPQKTWFVVRYGEDAFPGNITPLLRPLHTLLEREKDTERCIELLAEITQMYCTAVTDYSARLDEGLSNFALDDAGKLYYVDDDIYPWDRFVGYAQVFGVYLRQLPQIDTEACDELGKRIGMIWHTQHPFPHSTHVIMRNLRDIPVVGKKQTANLDALVAGITSVVKKKSRREIAAEEAAASRGKGKVKARREALRPDFDKNAPIALLADIHANAPALTVALDALRGAGIKNGLVLGDVVGYGPHPRECIDMLRAAGFATIKGNHDHATATGLYTRGINQAAKWAIDWSREELSEDERKWLDDLPSFIQEGDLYAVHGSPMDPSHFFGYVYRMTAGKNLDHMSANGLKVCFHGHSHMAGVYYREAGGSDGFGEESMELNGNSQSLICPGSVGKTRSGEPGVEYAIFDPTTGSLDMRRLDYDLEAAIKDMKKLNFPGVLIERLYKGM